MTALIDALLYLIIIGAAVLIAGALLCGIYRLSNSIRNMDRCISENREYIRRRLGRE